MKKGFTTALASVLAISMVLAAVGCGSKAPETNDAETNKTADNVETEAIESEASVDGESDVPVIQLKGLGDTSVEEASAQIDGTVYEGQLSTGATYFAYIPDNANYGNRATSNPILIVYGDTAYTAETAKEIVLSSGLAEIADHEQGPVILVNPLGDSWGEEDKDSYLAVKNMFSDGTGNTYNTYNQEGNEGRSETTTADDGTEQPGKYPGTCTRMYVFAEGSGANFAYEHLAQGIFGDAQYVGSAVWKPVGMFLLNADSQTDVDLKGATAEDYEHIENDAAREVPVVIVNGSENVINAFKNVDSEDKLLSLESEAQTMKAAHDELVYAYDEVIEHFMTRDMGAGVSLLSLRSASQQGLIETKNTFTSKDGIEVNYYQYLPEEYETLEDGSLPLVFGFHGGGNDAEMYVWSSGWAEVAADNDFMLVSVDQHVNLQEDHLDVMIELLNSLEEEYSIIDTSRVYASGFSMGSIMSSLLGFTYDDTFAAISPTNAISFIDSTHGNIVPVFYNAGENSHFNLPFMMEGAKAEVPTTNTDGRQQILDLMVNNDVMTKEEADSFEWPELTDDFIPAFAPGDSRYGIEADDVKTENCSMYYGVEETIRYYNSKDGNCYTALSSTTYAGHEPLWTVTKNAWDFMSQFSRNADGTVTVNK